MEFRSILYKGGQIEDFDTYKRLPKELQKFLKQINGIVAFSGGLYIYGCFKEPKWLSIGEIWNELHLKYEAISESDIPFAMDCLGDQYLLRMGTVVYLNGETGEVEGLGLSFNDFIKEALSDPVEFLSLHPLLQFHNEGNELKAGQLLNVYPPFCMKTDEDQAYSFKAVSVAEQQVYLSHLYSEIKNLNEGENITISIKD